MESKDTMPMVALEELHNIHQTLESMRRSISSIAGSLSDLAFTMEDK